MSDGGEQRPDNPADRVRELLERVSDALGLDAEVTVEQDHEGIHAALDGDDLGLFIGRHGQTIDAVQHVAFKVENREAGRGGVRVCVRARASRRSSPQISRAHKGGARTAVLPAPRRRQPNPTRTLRPCR